MRVLVVDQDSNLLTVISRTLGEYFSIDAVTNKSDALDLLRVNEFEVIVASERLEDGSGLELLGQLARNRPDMLRIFAADRERLKLLKGRLGPFGLFRTLSYPIELRQLLAALSAAAGIEAEIPEEEAEAETPPRAPAPAAPIRPTAEVTVTEAVRLPSPATRPASRVRSSNTSPAGVSSRTPRQPTQQALATAHRLDIVAKPKAFPPPSEPTPARSAFLVGAGVVLVLGGLILAFKIFNTPDEPIMTATQAGQRGAHFPPEVVKLVADTETAFQQDDYRTARTDVAALQQIAPDHPRLPFFESLLKRLESRTQEGSKPTTRLFTRHWSRGSGDTSAPAPATTEAPRRPGTPTPGEESAKTFSGRTIEESVDAQQPPGQALGSPIGPASETVEPRLIQRVSPDYPPEAARRRIEGSVEVSFTVSPDGKVSDILIVNAEPSDIFDRAAVDAVRRWRYDPKKVGGVPIEAHLQARVQFKLSH
jgi:TonB family protein